MHNQQSANAKGVCENIKSFYQELQLNTSESRKFVLAQPGVQKKILHALIFALKNVMTTGFAFVFVVAFSIISGTDNSAVGVIAVLGVLSFRYTDLDVRNKSAMIAFPVLFAILAVGPGLAHLGNPFTGAAVNAVCIFALLLLGCHRMEYMNQFTFVLGYLLLYGYHATGTAHLYRVIGLGVGAALVMIVYLLRHRDFACDRKLRDLFLDFDLRSDRSRWQLKTALLISAAILVLNLLGMPRPMWIGFVVLSVCYPFRERVAKRAVGRFVGTVCGLVLFALLSAVFPASFYPYLGLIGGIGVGFTTGYIFQTMFNAIGALSMAVSVLGTQEALTYRFVYNLAGAVFVFAAVYTGGRLYDRLRKCNVQG